MTQGGCAASCRASATGPISARACRAGSKVQTVHSTLSGTKRVRPASMHRPPAGRSAYISAAGGGVVEVQVIDEERTIVMVYVRKASVGHRVVKPDRRVRKAFVVDALTAKEVSSFTLVREHGHTASVARRIELRGIFPGHLAELGTDPWAKQAGSGHRLLNASVMVRKLHASALSGTTCEELLVVLIRNSSERIVQATGIASLSKVVDHSHAGLWQGACRQHLGTGRHRRGTSSSAQRRHMPRGIG